jgi:hypothetical protein
MTTPPLLRKMLCEREDVIPECFCRESRHRFPLGSCGNDGEVMFSIVKEFCK